MHQHFLQLLVIFVEDNFFWHSQGVLVVVICRARALSTKYNDNPASSSRPFDQARDGFVYVPILVSQWAANNYLQHVTITKFNLEPNHVIKLQMVLVCTSLCFSSWVVLRKELIYLKLVINAKVLTWNIAIGKMQNGWRCRYHDIRGEKVWHSANWISLGLVKVDGS